MQDSLGFSPAELVFGHIVCGPFNVLKDRFFSAKPSLKKNVLDFVSDLCERLHQACSFARKAHINPQAKMKVQFDRSAVALQFEVGAKVLVLLPIRDSYLSAWFSGPYCVLQKLSDGENLMSVKLTC